MSFCYPPAIPCYSSLVCTAYVLFLLILLRKGFKAVQVRQAPKETQEQYNRECRPEVLYKSISSPE